MSFANTKLEGGFEDPEDEEAMLAGLDAELGLGGG